MTGRKQILFCETFCKRKIVRLIKLGKVYASFKTSYFSTYITFSDTHFSWDTDYCKFQLSWLVFFNISD